MCRTKHGLTDKHAERSVKNGAGHITGQLTPGINMNHIYILKQRTTGVFNRVK